SIFTSLDASEFLTDLAIPGLFGAVIVGQILTAIVARRCLHSTLFTVGSSGMTIACALILFQTAESAFTGFVVFGFSQGIYIIIGQSLWADFYGRAHIGKIKGLVWGIVVLASSVGGFALTLGETPQTQFQPIKQAMVAMAIFTVACTFIQKPTLPHRPRADHPDSPPS
ncbi:MAG: hypothetical protein VX438_03165, partial [Planctomycetota bacterium]|nr:hypothetical protein [Planctomycetota bacterium]